MKEQIVTKEGVYPSHAEHVQSRTLDHRFGVDVGEPLTWNTSGDHDLYDPAPGKRVRLRWLLIYSDPANNAPCLVNVKWSAGSKPGIYRAPFPAGYGAFGKSGVREGDADAKLQINLSADQTVYVNLAVEEF